MKRCSQCHRDTERHTYKQVAALVTMEEFKRGVVKVSLKRGKALNFGSYDGQLDDQVLKMIRILTASE